MAKFCIRNFRVEMVRTSVDLVQIRDFSDFVYKDDLCEGTYIAHVTTPGGEEFDIEIPVGGCISFKKEDVAECEFDDGVYYFKVESCTKTITTMVPYVAKLLDKLDNLKAVSDRSEDEFINELYDKVEVLKTAFEYGGNPEQLYENIREQVMYS
jgi:hypothetical protein